MKFKIEKKEEDVNFINSESNEKFDYIEFAEKLYSGEKIKITSFGNVTPDEKEIINLTVSELNDLSNSKKRKKIISQYNEE